MNTLKKSKCIKSDTSWLLQFSEALNRSKFGSDDESKELLTKSIKEIKSDIEIIKDFKGMKIYAIAVNKNELENRMLNVKCYHEKPISQCTINIPNDSCVVPGVDLLCLGNIPYNFVMKTKSGFDFLIDIPIPEKTFRKYMQNNQLLKLKEFKQRYKEDRFTIKFLQLVRTY